MGHCRGLLVLSSVLLLISLCASSRAEPQNATLTLSEYISELDRLASSVKQLTQAEEVPKLLTDIPSAWRIQTEQQTFEVSTEWLRNDLNDWQRQHSQEIQDRISTRLQTLRSEAALFQKPPEDVSRKRVLLNGILAAREFQNVRGPTWLDRFKQRVMEILTSLLGRVFESSTIPTITNVFVYGLIALALLVVAYWMYRTIRDNTGLETILPTSLPVSSKGWKLWIAEARRAADDGNWRDAIHLAYWCGISFLEGQGLWKPDTARTPREYLRLLPPASEHRQSLGTLTQQFELVWYGTEQADANSFSETITQLERMGCQSN